MYSNLLTPAAQALIDGAQWIDWYFWWGQSNGTPNCGNKGSFVGTAYNETMSVGTYPLGLTLNPGWIPGVRDAAPPQAIGDINIVGGNYNQPLFPVTAIGEGRDWFDALVQELEQHGESQGTAFFKTLNALDVINGSAGRVYGATCLNRDSDTINTNLIGSGSAGTIAGCASWFYQCVKFLYSVFGSKLRIPACIYVGGEANASLGTVTVTASVGTALTLPLSNATLNTSTFSLNTAPASGFSAGGGYLMIDTSVGRTLATYGSATAGVFTNVNTSMPAAYNGATVLAGASVVRADYAGNAGYTGGVSTVPGSPGLFSLQAYCQATVTSILGGTPFVPLFVDQQFTILPSATLMPTAELAYLAWLQGSASGVTNPIQLLGTKYHQASSSVGPGLHVGCSGHQRMGELTGRAVNSVIYQSNAWTPMYITSATYVTGNTVVLTYNVPVGSVTFDAKTVRVNKSASAVNVWGFSYRDSGGTITVSSVAITASNQVTVTLSGSPAANTNRMIGYAITADYGTGGQTAIGGTRGCIRDGDTYTSLFGYDAFNRAVAQEVGF